MTAEIAIMNREGIALAADSAVTMGGAGGVKIFTSANKIFTLSKYRPMGIMVYDSAYFMGVPWEVIIKSYRENLGKKSFCTVKEYLIDFIKFLEEDNKIIDEGTREGFLGEIAGSFFNYIKSQIVKDVELKIPKDGGIKEAGIIQVINERLDVLRKAFEKGQVVPGIDIEHKNIIKEKYRDTINKALELVFEKLPLSAENIDLLKELAAEICCKFPEGLTAPYQTGLVIAGFGEDEYSPSLVSIVAEMAIGNKLKYRNDRERRIGGSLMSSIIPFAQREVVATFMDGIDPERQRIERAFVGEMMDDFSGTLINKIESLDDKAKEAVKEISKGIIPKKLKGYDQKIGALRQAKYVKPVMDVISLLPKDELAAVAETFVSLAVFKKRVTMQFETVGGPIDVAVISKGDGFVWIKRKHYFKPELNPRFFQNYWEVSNGN